MPLLVFNFSKSLPMPLWVFFPPTTLASATRQLRKYISILLKINILLIKNILFFKFGALLSQVLLVEKIPTTALNSFYQYCTPLGFVMSKLPTTKPNTPIYPSQALTASKHPPLFQRLELRHPSI